MHGAPGRDPDVSGKPPDKEFPDLPGAPVRLVLFQAHDHALNRLGQLVCIAHRPARAVGQRLEPLILVAVVNLIAGLSRDAELPAEIAHALAIEKPNHKTKTFLHRRTRFPRHQHPPRQKAKSVTDVSGTNCHLCLGSLKRLAGFAPIQKPAWVAPTSHEKITTALLQRRYNIGFARANRLMDELRKKKLVK